MGHHHTTPDGARLYWEEEGEGPRLLLVHGGTGTSAFDWQLVRGSLARRHRLILTDLRGHGHSTDPDERLGIEQIGADVASLLDEIGGADAIMAFSVSASALLALLCRRPRLTRAFVCIGASTVGDASAVDGILNGPWPSQLKALEHEHGTGPDHWRRLQAALARSWADYELTPEDLRRLDTPTLVVCGDRDRIEPVETALAICRTLPDAELLVLPRCGHFASRDRPEELAAVVQRFLDRVLGAGQSAARPLRREASG